MVISSLYYGHGYQWLIKEGKFCKDNNIKWSEICALNFQETEMRIVKGR